MIKYYDIIKDMNNKFNYRFHMVKLAQEKSVSHAADVFATTRPTVRKWRDRYEQYGPKGLEDQSRAPKNVHNKTPELDEAIIQTTREQYSQWGTKRLRDLAGLPYGKTAIYNTLKRKGLVGKRKKSGRRNAIFVSGRRNILECLRNSSLTSNNLMISLNSSPTLKSSRCLNTNSLLVRLSQALPSLHSQNLLIPQLLLSSFNTLLNIFSTTALILQPLPFNTITVLNSSAMSEKNNGLEHFLKTLLIGLVLIIPASLLLLQLSIVMLKPFIVLLSKNSSHVNHLKTKHNSSQKLFRIRFSLTTLDPIHTKMIYALGRLFKKPFQTSIKMC